MFLDAISLIAKILAVIVVTIAGVTLLYLLVDFIFNCLAERQDVEASIIGVEKEKDFYHYPIFTGSITAFRISKKRKYAVQCNGIRTVKQLFGCVWRLFNTTKWRENCDYC